MNENIRFFLKVTFAHILTYTLCGIIAMNVNNYLAWIAEQDNWRQMDDIIFQLALVFQILRGVLYGIVLLMIKDTIVYSKYGIIKLFIIMIILGMFNTPAPGPNSIEGFIYLKPPNEPLSIALGGTLEIMIQNLLFCIIVCTKWKGIKNRIFKNKKNV
jgi:hypothetical protein